MTKWCRRWYYHNYCLIKNFFFWFTLVLLLSAASTSGYFVAMVQSANTYLEDKAGYETTITNLQSVNAELLFIIKRQLPKLTASVQDAINTSNRSSKTVQRTATKVEKKVDEIQDSLVPEINNVVVEKEAPDWLGGP